MKPIEEQIDEMFEDYDGGWIPLEPESVAHLIPFVKDGTIEMTVGIRPTQTYGATGGRILRG